MKKFFSIGVVIILAMNFISCRSTKNMKFLQDLYGETKNEKFVRPPEYLIKADDNLFVDVQSMNQEVSQLFSTSKSGGYNGGTQSEFGQVSSQYLNGYQVNQKGMILLPVIGEVHVAGMTEEIARDSVQSRVGEYFKDANVKVKILTYKVTVLGEVRNPGVYYNYNKSMTILDALGLASGTTEFASIKKVLVLRSTAAGSKSYRVDMTKKNMMNSEAYFLLPNDVIYIEPDIYKNNTINNSKFSLALAALSTTVLILSYINK